MSTRFSWMNSANAALSNCLRDAEKRCFVDGSEFSLRQTKATKKNVTIMKAT